MVDAESNLRRVTFTHRGVETSFALVIDMAKSNHAGVASWLSSGKFYEPDVSAFLLRVLQPGDSVIDVGANLGYFTVLAATLVGEAGRVLAFEPDPDNLADIDRNLQASGLAERVSLVAAPAMDFAEEVAFFINADNSGGNALWNPADFPGNVKTQADPRQLSLRGTTIDAELRTRSLPHLKVIKIDTEGAEERVLLGALQTLVRRQPEFVICELHEFGLQKLGGSQASLRELMHRLGYACAVLGLQGGCPRPVPHGIAIESPFIPNLVFHRPGALNQFWSSGKIDPRSF